MYWEFNYKNDFLWRMRFIRSFRLFIRQFLTIFEAEYRVYQPRMSVLAILLSLISAKR